LFFIEPQSSSGNRELEREIADGILLNHDQPEMNAKRESYAWLTLTST
ncbi:MAG: hypothetical protein ACI805_002874, partial [Candidatus Azotimanducaceae bacterium]